MALTEARDGKFSAPILVSDPLIAGSLAPDGRNISVAPLESSADVHCVRMVQMVRSCPKTDLGMELPSASHMEFELVVLISRPEVTD
jgi:hypothetical protein